MPIKRPPLVTNEVYHVIVRGIEGRRIFDDDTDRYRAVKGLYYFNDDNPVDWSFRKISEKRSRKKENKEKDKRRKLVKILAFCLMPNHIHLLLRQVKDGGISKFMRKFGAGYGGYFNRRHGRQGYLFQGRFRAVHIASDEQLKIVFAYIHTNPAALFNASWKKGEIKNPAAVIKRIERYKWSSYRDYLGYHNFPKVTEREFLNQIMTAKEWRSFVNECVKSKKFRETFSEFKVV